MVAGVWLASLPLGPWLEPLLLVAATALGCVLITDLVVRRIDWLRPMFGMKRLGKRLAGRRGAVPVPG